MSDPRGQGGQYTKYKTTLCKHFQQSGSCPKRNECGFAHGDHELQAGSNPGGSGGGANNGFQQQQHFVNKGMGGQGGFQSNYRNFNGGGGMGQSGQQKAQFCRYFNEDTGKSTCRNEGKCGFAHSKEEQQERMMQQGQSVMPIQMQYYAIQQQQQQQQLAGQMVFLQTLLMHKYSVALHQLFPQIEAVIDKSKYQEEFKSAELQNKQGNPTGSADLLYQILKDRQSEKEVMDLIEDIEKAHKSAVNIDQTSITALLSNFGMTNVEISQLLLYQQHNVQMMGLQQQQMMQYGMNDQLGDAM